MAIDWTAIDYNLRFQSVIDDRQSSKWDRHWQVRFFKLVPARPRFACPVTLSSTVRAAAFDCTRLDGCHLRNVCWDNNHISTIPGVYVWTYVRVDICTSRTSMRLVPHWFLSEGTRDKVRGRSTWLELEVPFFFIYSWAWLVRDDVMVKSHFEVSPLRLAQLRTIKSERSERTRSTDLGDGPPWPGWSRPVLFCTFGSVIFDLSSFMFYFHSWLSSFTLIFVFPT